MTRSVQGNLINSPYPQSDPQSAGSTSAETAQRIATSQAAVAAGGQKAAGNCSRPAGSVCLPVGAIDIAKLEQLAPKCM